MASSAARLIRSSVEAPSCLPNDVRPTPVMKLMEQLFRHSGMRPLGRRPGIHNRRSWLWIPGSRVKNARPGMTVRGFASSSIRLRQAEHFLGNETQDQLRADRRDARDQGFAKIPLDVIFLGVAKSA